MQRLLDPLQRLAVEYCHFTRDTMCLQRVKNLMRSLSATEQHELMPAACTGLPHAVLQRWV